MGRPRTNPLPTVTYRERRRCLLCAAPIEDQARVPDVCNKPVGRGGHRTFTTVVQVTTGHPDYQPLEVLELTHTMVMPAGWRRWVGTGEDRRRIIWDEVAS